MKKAFRIKMKKIIFFTLCLVSTSALPYNSLSGNNIYKICAHLDDKPRDIKTYGSIMDQSIQRAHDIGMCHASIMTAFQAMTFVTSPLTNGIGFMKCMSEYYRFSELTDSQIIDMTLKYLKDNPKDRSESIAQIVASMIMKEFPASVCK